MNADSNERASRDLEVAIQARNRQSVSDSLELLNPSEALHTVSALDESTQTELLDLLPDEAAAKLLDRLPDAQAAQMIERLSTAKAAAIVNELPSDEQADVISRLADRGASAILDAMNADDARDARQLMSYPPESAGGLMITEFLAYSEGLNVDDVLNDLRSNAERYHSFDVQYAYVVSAGGKLVGVLRLRDLLLSKQPESLPAVMISNPLKVRDTANLEELERFFDRHPLFG